MTRIVKAKNKLMRNLGVAIWENKADDFAKRNYRSGQHGKKSFKKTSDYGAQLNAKQVLRWHYGMTEKQFHNTFEKAKGMRRGSTPSNFIDLLERRLCVLVYKLGFAPTIFAAKQLVSHKHIMVDGKVVNVGSAVVPVGSEVSVVESSRSMPVIAESNMHRTRGLPPHISCNPESFTGKVVSNAHDIRSIPYTFNIDEILSYIIEYYSR